MGKIFNFTGLSNTEIKIMEQLWKIDQPLSLKEITEFLNKQLNKEWKQQTVGTYLSHLQKAGIIKTDKRFSKLYLYFPSCTKEEYLEKCACNFVEQVFDNSLSSFIAAFAKEGKISQRDAEELKKLI
ncbi:transcriptional regulator [bacterium D16-54]|nr:transcriptional regulator [bacterium D16-54]RKJ09470.1 transcriptional regulator [bacterium D16-56]